jgi:hypothetical protein
MKTEKDKKDQIDGSESGDEDEDEESQSEKDKSQQEQVCSLHIESIKKKLINKLTVL